MRHRYSHLTLNFLVALLLTNGNVYRNIKLKSKNMGFVKEFKAFAMRGNVVDLAIGVIIGGAFGKIVSSVVADIITPAILTPALKAANLMNLSDLVIPGTAVKYGNFLSQIISFVIVAFALFLLIKGINSLQKKEKAATASKSSKEEVLLVEIRDLLKAKA